MVVQESLEVSSSPTGDRVSAEDDVESMILAELPFLPHCCFSSDIFSLVIAVQAVKVSSTYI